MASHQAKIISITFDHHFAQLISLSKDRTARVWQFDHIMETETKTVKINKKVARGPVLALVYDRSKQQYATSH